VELELACLRASIEDDGPELHRLFTGAGFIPEPEKLDPADLMAYVREGVGWYTSDQELLLTQAAVARAALQTSDPRSSHFRTMRHQDINPEHLFGRRLELLTLAVLGQLEASNNWYRIAREWIYGDDPVTELGRREAEFFGS
jgi:hypothetical protein